MKRFLSILIVLCIPLPGYAQQDSIDEISKGEVLFATKVQPILIEKCIACHGADPDELGGDFDLRNRDSALAGGESFGKEVLIPRKATESVLYRVVAHLEDGYEMPPKLADRLSQEEAWTIREWINAGAPWPDGNLVADIQKHYAEGVQVVTSKALSTDWQNRRYESEKLWSYRPLKRSNVPDDKHPIDWFIDHGLETAGLVAAPDADPVKLGRRLSFGLTGLPPKTNELSKFLSEYRKDQPAAIESYAQTLMASPHYGEQFARHWLDVTRYADSAGFANDYSRPHAWRYRDYVVRSFNRDKPYDRFVIEQLAGDELDASNPENLIATSYLRMGPWELTAMSVFKEMRQLWLDDVTDSVGQTFLGHPLQCAKCHDHKFDPVPTRDYYRMMSVFSTTQFAERKAPFLKSESRKHFPSADKWSAAKIGYYERDLKTLNEKIAKQRKQETGDAKVGDNGLDPGDEASKARVNKNLVRHRLERFRISPFAHSVYTGFTVPLKTARNRAKLPKNPWAKGEFDPDVIFTGGDVYSYGDKVVPGALSAAESLGEMNVKPFPAAKGKRRLALAKWIVDKKNPLAARVIVNRVWSWHFGRGITANPNNLGATGGLPTHPELLDFLADWFMRNDWSIKKLNGLILSSKAYRRSTLHPDLGTLDKLDPKRQLYSVFLPRRLTAEEMRDAMLVASGEINLEIGGIPCRPDINPDVALQPRTIMGNTASVYEPDPLPEQRNRRSLYAEKLRGLRDPFLESFNQPVMDDSCELRETSTVAPQALTLMNSAEVQDRSIAFANRLIQSKVSDEMIIRNAFEACFSRQPKRSELEVCLEAWKTATSKEEQLKPIPNTLEPTLTRTVMAEKTGEPYTFVEHVPAYESYIPDLQRSDVDARTRGLAHVCLVLFNANEFVYID